MEIEKELALLRANYTLVLNELERVQTEKTIAEQEARLWKMKCTQRNLLVVENDAASCQNI